MPEQIAKANDRLHPAAVEVCKKHGLRDPATGLTPLHDPVDALDRYILGLDTRIARLEAQAEAREAVIDALKQRMITGRAA